MSDYAGNDQFPAIVELPDGGDKRSALSVNVPLEGLADRTVYNKNRIGESVPKLGGPGGSAKFHLQAASPANVTIDPATTNFVLADNNLAENKTLTLLPGNDGDEIYYFRRGVTHAFSVTLQQGLIVVAVDDSGNTNQTWIRLRYFREEFFVVDPGWYPIAWGPTPGDIIAIRDIAFVL